jgi:ABC-type proline/glycine betaine transport system permease subunit
LQTDFDTKIYLGAAGSVVLALVVDAALVGLQRWLTPWDRATGER